MRLSLVVGLYNMRREIPRTLASLASSYQHVPADEYEIILVDNGSTTRPDEGALGAIASNVRYIYVPDAPPSPTAAINQAVADSQGELVTVVIDGARMFSPGVLRTAFRAFDAFDDPYVYAPSLHLGPQLQNDSAYRGYDQAIEDKLLSSVDWQSDGYQLFEVSNIASVPERLAKPTFESNCFTVRRSTWDRVGGYHEGFATSVGGGLANWELFARYMSDAAITPVLLAGEATFHQFHGGASTNQPRANHPVRGWFQEHIEIFGVPYAWPQYEPVLLGSANPPFVTHLFEQNSVAHTALLHQLLAAREHQAAIAIGRELCDRFPNDPARLQTLAGALDQASRRAEALVAIDQAIEIAPTQAELHVTRGIVNVGLGNYDIARSSYDQAIELDQLLAEAFFHRGHLSLRQERTDAAVEDFEQAIALESNPPPHYLSDLDEARQRAAPGAPSTTDEQPHDIDGLLGAFGDSVQRHYGHTHSLELINEHALHGSFSADELAGLSRIAAEARPTRALVIGAYLGLSTRALLEATRQVGTSVVSIDPNLRHRVFSAPLDHARTFAAEDADRVQFIDGFFGERTDNGTRFDLHHFAPHHDESDAAAACLEVPVVLPPEVFDFVLVDADLGSELALTNAALTLVASDARLVLMGEQGGRIAQLIAFGRPTDSVAVSSVEAGRGFVVVDLAMTGMVG